MYAKLKKQPLSTNPAQKPKSKAAQLPNGRTVGNVIVNAIPGFNIRGKHKFNFVKRDDRVKLEYCKTCGTARRILHIDGASVDYVARAIKAYSAGWPCDEFDLAHAQKVVKAAVIQNYQDVLNGRKPVQDQRV